MWNPKKIVEAILGDLRSVGVGGKNQSDSTDVNGGVIASRQILDLPPDVSFTRLIWAICVEIHAFPEKAPDAPVDFQYPDLGEWIMNNVEVRLSTNKFDELPFSVLLHPLRSIAQVEPGVLVQEIPEEITFHREYGNPGIFKTIRPGEKIEIWWRSDPDVNSPAYNIRFLATATLKYLSFPETGHVRK